MSSPPVGHNGGPEFYTDCGWVAIARGMRKHSLVGFHLHANPMDANRGAMQPALAWIDLIMECRYAPGEVSNNGKKMQLQRGQLVGATSWLADRWNWTPKAVRNWLEKLEKAGMISFETQEESKGELKGRLEGRSSGRSKGRFANIITLCNYDEYQLPQRAQGQVEGQVEGQVDGPEKGRLDAIYPRARETSKQDNKITIQESSKPADEHSAAREGLAGLNGFADDAICNIKAWMNNGDDLSARNWLNSTMHAYGADVFKDAYVKLTADMASGVSIAFPLKTLSNIAARIRDERKAKPKGVNGTPTHMQRW